MWTASFYSSDKFFIIFILVSTTITTNADKNPNVSIENSVINCILFISVIFFPLLREEILPYLGAENFVGAKKFSKLAEMTCCFCFFSEFLPFFWKIPKRK